MQNFSYINSIKLKAMKKLIQRIPKSILLILCISISIYILVLLFSLFDININEIVLGAYPFISPKFSLYQIFTSMLTHDEDVFHITVNMIIFLLFSFSIFRLYGNRGVYITYIISGICSTIFAIICMSIKYNENILYLKQVGIELTDQQLEHGQLSIDYIIDNNLNKQQIREVNFYNQGASYLIGASGAIAGIMMVYLLCNILYRKKLLYNLLILFFITITLYQSYMYFDSSYLISATGISHLGGFIGGIISFILIKTVKKGEIIRP